jgi:hypothetical protein
MPCLYVGLIDQLAIHGINYDFLLPSGKPPQMRLSFR